MRGQWLELMNYNDLDRINKLQWLGPDLMNYNDLDQIDELQSLEPD